MNAATARIVAVIRTLVETIDNMISMFLVSRVWTFLSRVDSVNMNDDS